MWWTLLSCVTDSIHLKCGCMGVKYGALVVLRAPKGESEVRSLMGVGKAALSLVSRYGCPVVPCMSLSNSIQAIPPWLWLGVGQAPGCV